MNIPIDHLLRTANERHVEVPYQIADLHEVVDFLSSPFVAYLAEVQDRGLFLTHSPDELPHVPAALIQGLRITPKAD